MLIFESLIKRKVFHRTVLLIIPLALSAFTHLWNPIGFPSFYVDEGHYMRRAVQVLEGLGSQESASGYNENRQYDHPYFGQLFLAAALKLANFPNVTDAAGNVHSIEMLYMVPRLLMGVLGVIDTFLIYKICERRYNRNIALIASILFAVMPLSWFVRRILLESVQLPFILLSILFAVRAGDFSRDGKITTPEKYTDSYHMRSSLVVLLSGIFLGIAIFTKIPAIAIIPAIAFLIYVNNNKNLKTLGLWFIPVLLIPLIWPAYGLFAGEFDEWIDDVKWQTGRFYRSLSASLEWDMKMDPVLLILGIAGIAFALIKRDLFPILWSIPFLLFLDYVGYAQYFHLIPLIPIFCISGAILIDGLPRMIVAKYRKHAARFHLSTDNKDNEVQTDLNRFVENMPPKRSTELKITQRSRYIPFGIIAGIGIFGLITTAMLITLNLNSVYLMISSSIAQSLNSNSDTHDAEVDSSEVVVIGQRHWGIHYSWIPRYIHGLDFEFLPFRDIEALKGGENILLIHDKRLNSFIFSDDADNEINVLRTIFNNTNAISAYNDKHYHDRNVYPYTSLHQNRRVDIMELRTNY